MIASPPRPLRGKPILVTGGAGFIGSTFVRGWLAERDAPVVNLDKLTYAGSRANLAGLESDARHVFVQGDIGDMALVSHLLSLHRPAAIVNFAAETHVDRSIAAPNTFIETNVGATLRLLDAARAYAAILEPHENFRFLHISTDEVYGDLGPDNAPFTETSPYAPSSPYAASKAASDHLARAWHRTYELPVIVTHCSNNYGPRQFPEKLIPLTIRKALAGEALPVYGDGLHRRDWLYVGDHCAALQRVLEGGLVGETYDIGGGNEMRNIDLVRMLCGLLDRLRPLPGGRSYADQISFVADRPGHDRRYAIDGSRIAELGWRPRESFAEGLEKTVRWHLGEANEAHAPTLRKAALS